jgi:hypothetical protein
MLDELKES